MRVSRQLLGCLAVFALVPGVVPADVWSTTHAPGHDGHTHHHPLGPRPPAGHVHVAESHPGQPLHVEASALSDAPHCEVCAQLLERSRAPRQVCFWTAPPVADGRIFGTTLPPPATPRRLLQARAPPLPS